MDKKTGYENFTGESLDNTKASLLSVMVQCSENGESIAGLLEILQQITDEQLERAKVIGRIEANIANRVEEMKA